MRCFVAAVAFALTVAAVSLPCRFVWADPAAPSAPTGTARRLIDLPPIDAQGGQDRWAVVIGISKYQRPQLSLQFGSDDARSVAQTLETRCGFSPDHVKLLTDEQATAANIREALGVWLAHAAGRGDLVVIYYSGHGAPDIDPSVAEDGIRKYLIPYDTDPANLFGTAVPLDDLSSALLRLRSEQTVVLLDCCYSGSASAAGAPEKARSFRREGVDVAGKMSGASFDTLARSGRGRAVLTACDANESSYEYADFGHGAFTHFLLDGLNGKAADASTGNVTVNGLYEYIFNGFQALGTSRRKQTPNLVTSAAGILTLAGPSTSPVAAAAATGIVNISSSPLGAQVFVDSDPKPILTPTALTLTRGAHQITLYKPGYLPVSDEVFVSTVHPTLQSYVLNVEETKGDLLLLAPVGAQVAVDQREFGVMRGDVMRVSGLLAGSHQLQFHGDSFAPSEQEVMVQAGRLTIVRANLRKNLTGARAASTNDVPPGLTRESAANGTAAYRWAKDGAAMVFVSAGPFRMGSAEADGARPEHEENVPGFWIDRCEVTEAQYARFAHESGYQTKGGWSPHPETTNHPVVNVTLDDARAYAAWAGKRIPTEAQWEKAARGTDGRRYTYEGEFAPLSQNLRMYGFKAPLDVGSLSASASPYGALDMLGNVWEWCDSRFDPYPGNTAPDANMNGRNYVIRGGSFLSPALRDEVSVAARAFLLPNLGQEDVGFRCVAAAP